MGRGSKQRGGERRVGWLEGRRKAIVRKGTETEIERGGGAVGSRAAGSERESVQGKARGSIQPLESS